MRSALDTWAWSSVPSVLVQVPEQYVVGQRVDEHGCSATAARRRAPELLRKQLCDAHHASYMVHRTATRPT